MSLTDKEQKTVAYYDRSGEEWAAAHASESSWWLAEMQKFRAMLPSGKVLEIGSGAGKDAQALIQMGYQYVGTDASKGLRTKAYLIWTILKTFLMVSGQQQPCYIFPKTKLMKH